LILTCGNILTNGTFYGVGRHSVASYSAEICDGWRLEQRHADRVEPVTVDVALPTGLYIALPQGAAAVRLVQSLDAYDIDEAVFLATTLDVVEHTPGAIASIFLTVGSREDPMRAERVHTTLAGVPPPDAEPRQRIDTVVPVRRSIYLMQPYKFAIALAPGARVEIRSAGFRATMPDLSPATNAGPEGSVVQ